MPKATVRANARALPEAEPIDECARLEKTFANEKRKAEVAAKADQEKFVASQNFAKAYHSWLSARAGIEDPSIEEEEQPGRFKADADAERALFSTAAAYPDQVWQKLEAFEIVLSDELVSGPRTDSVLMFALGSIKSDILNLDLCNGEARA